MLRRTERIKNQEPTKLRGKNNTKRKKKKKRSDISPIFRKLRLL